MEPMDNSCDDCLSSEPRKGTQMLFHHCWTGKFLGRLNQCHAMESKRTLTG
jgi:hypothetical protein